MTLTESVISAIVLGVITLPHCLVMCGPVAAVACTSSGRGAPRGRVSWRDGAAYFFGRLAGYAAVGSVMGVIGAHAFTLLGADRVGRAALVGLAITCVWQAYRMLRPAKTRLAVLTAKPRARPLLSLLASFVPKRGLGLGLVTALFPCGALPAAWAIAASSGHPVPGALAMFAFALASTPALVIAVGGRELAQRVATRVPRAFQAAFWLALATLLVVRACLIEAPCHGG